MAELADIVIDCPHPASLARFWKAVLDNYQIAPYDEAEIARLASVGIHDIEDDPTVLLQPTNDGLRIWFQKVPESKSCKNRVHLDVRAADLGNESSRLQRLGATIASVQPNAKIVVMADPAGNEFCVIHAP